MIGSFSAWALGCALLGPLLLSAASAATPLPPSGECVAGLRNVRAGSGAKSFDSTYVFSNRYALGEWAAGAARGQSLWQKHGALWCKIQTGADVLDQRALEGYGVSRADARALLAKMKAVTHR